jgi:hypothetical protein
MATPLNSPSTRFWRTFLPPAATHNMDLAGGPAGVACGRARSSSRISSMNAAMPPVVSSRRRCCARVIRVDVALGRATGSRRRALGQREEGAILGSASSQGDDVHANRKSRIICLSPGLPCCRNHSDRQNRQSQNAHRNPLRHRYDINAHIDLSQLTFSREPALARRVKFKLSACHKADVTVALVNVRC